MILDGNQVAGKIYKSLEPRIEKLKHNQVEPSLATVLVGEDPRSLSFIKIKEKASQNLGIVFKIFQMPAISSERNIIEKISDLNDDQSIHGIVLQLPLPKSLDENKIIETIAPEKDIDGLLGNFSSPTALAILELLKSYQIDYRNLKIVIVGHGRLVGKPLVKLFRNEKIEPIVCDLGTSNIREKTLSADLLISATGSAGLIGPKMVKEGAVLIDAGTAESNGRIAGDITPETYGKAKAYAPVPGGVGPVTVACLIRNLVSAAEDKLSEINKMKPSKKEEK